MTQANHLRVPWVMGAVATGGPRMNRPTRSREVRRQRKTGQIKADIRQLERLLAHLGAGARRRRETVEGALAWHHRRLAWLEATASATVPALGARRVEILHDLGVDGRDHYRDGLPERLTEDQRFMDLLGEVSIIDFVLRE